jgi:hypothetical protein
MDIDFHYHATYAAARFAGYSGREALVIAASAQMIDENARNVMTEVSSKHLPTLAGFKDISGARNDIAIRAPDGSKLHTFRAQITFQLLLDIGTNSLDTTNSIWPVYHFLPGNFVPNTSPTQSDQAADLITVRARDGQGTMQSPRWSRRSFTGSSPGASRVQKFFGWLCRPHSPMAIGLVNNCTDLVHDPTSQVAKHNLALHMAGVTMHVFVDTWAHQDFVGPAVREINGRENKPQIGWVPSDSHHTLPTITGQPDLPPGVTLATHKDGWGADTAPDVTFDRLNVGHGQVGHWPDHSSLIWQYKPMWSSAAILRNNPWAYFDAFVHMVYALYCIRNNTQYQPFNVTKNTLRQLCSISAEGNNPSPLTQEGLKIIAWLLWRKRDPWGPNPGDDYHELPDNLKTKAPITGDWWDKAMWANGRIWRSKQEQLGFGTVNVPPDWNPGHSAWIGNVYQTVKYDEQTKERWVTDGEFQALNYFKFNVAAKMHYRYVKQQLRAFGQELLGHWADGDVYVDDFDRVVAPRIYVLGVPWRQAILDLLDKHQKATKKQDLSEGLAILAAEINLAPTLADAVRLLYVAVGSADEWRAVAGPNETRNWAYGFEIQKNGNIKSSDRSKSIRDLITKLEKAAGEADLTQRSGATLPTPSTWLEYSNITFKSRSSELKIIDKALSDLHKQLELRGLTDRTGVADCANTLVQACSHYIRHKNGTGKRVSSVVWLKIRTELWLSQYTAH